MAPEQQALYHLRDYYACGLATLSMSPECKMEAAYGQLEAKWSLCAQSLNILQSHWETLSVEFQNELLAELGRCKNLIGALERDVSQEQLACSQALMKARRWTKNQSGIAARSTRISMDL